MLRVANATNGLAFPPYDCVSMFLSTHGHNYSMGYFRIDAMPYRAIIELLGGGEIKVVDATQHDKPLPDALKFGVTTFALVFNRAVGEYKLVVAPWQTREMRRAALSGAHKKLVQRIRRLVKVFGHSGPVEMGKQVQWEVHRNFPWDDKPEKIMEVKQNGK